MRSLVWECSGYVRPWLTLAAFAKRMVFLGQKAVNYINVASGASFRSDAFELGMAAGAIFTRRSDLNGRLAEIIRSLISHNLLCNNGPHGRRKFLAEGLFIW